MPKGQNQTEKPVSARNPLKPKLEKLEQENKSLKRDLEDAQSAIAALKERAEELRSRATAATQDTSGRIDSIISYTEAKQKENAHLKKELDELVALRSKFPSLSEAEANIFGILAKFDMPQKVHIIRQVAAKTFNHIAEESQKSIQAKKYWDNVLQTAQTAFHDASCGGIVTLPKD